MNSLRNCIFLPLILLLTLTNCDGGNILAIFQHFGYSHFKVYYPVLKALIERGHQLTVVSYIKNLEPHPNYKELLLTGEPQIHAANFDDFVVGRTPGILFGEYLELHTEGQRSCEKFYESTYVEQILASHAEKPFDLVITEYFNTDCHLGIPYMMEVPIVAFSSCALMPWLYDRIMLPDTPSFVQSEFIGFPEELNAMQRFLNFMQMKLLKFSYRFHTNRNDNLLIKKYLKIDIDINEIAKRQTGVVFVNQHYSLSGSRPLSPQLIEIGGVHIDPKEVNATLPADVDKFLAKVRPNEDVMLISFGSMLRASSFEKKKINAIHKVLQRRNLKVIWKWEADELPLKSEHILFVKWLPQLSVLCHPKVKYFWGHGGMLSTTEAVHCAKPLILTPIYGDQFLNAHAVQNRKIGVILDYNEIDERSVEATFNEIQRPRYSTNVLSLSKMFTEREMKPLDKAIWYIEHIATHKTKAVEVLQTKAMHLNFFIYHSLDTIAIIVAILILLIMLCMRICRSKSKSHNQVQKCQNEHLTNRKNR